MKSLIENNGSDGFAAIGAVVVEDAFSFLERRRQCEPWLSQQQQRAAATWLISHLL
ncbi:MAG: hypothetical protein WKF77_04020 [Planctomycetaceae bacterium]